MTEGRIMRERIGDLELDLSDVDKLCDVRRGGPNNGRAVCTFKLRAGRCGLSEPRGGIYLDFSV